MSYLDDLFNEEMNLEDCIDDCIEDPTYHIEDDAYRYDCCKNCPNRNNANGFCNCALPAMTNVYY